MAAMLSAEEVQIIRRFFDSVADANGKLAPDHMHKFLTMLLKSPPTDAHLRVCPRARTALHLAPLTLVNKSVSVLMLSSPLALNTAELPQASVLHRRSSKLHAARDRTASPSSVSWKTYSVW